MRNLEAVRKEAAEMNSALMNVMVNKELVDKLQTAFGIIWGKEGVVMKLTEIRLGDHIPVRTLEQQKDSFILRYTAWEQMDEKIQYSTQFLKAACVIYTKEYIENC